MRGCGYAAATWRCLCAVVPMLCCRLQCCCCCWCCWLKSTVFIAAAAAAIGRRCCYFCCCVLLLMAQGIAVTGLPCSVQLVLLRTVTCGSSQRRRGRGHRSAAPTQQGPISEGSCSVNAAPLQTFPFEEDRPFPSDSVASLCDVSERPISSFV